MFLISISFSPPKTPQYSSITDKSSYKEKLEVQKWVSVYPICILNFNCNILSIKENKVIEHRIKLAVIFFLE